jgi:steroid delta-isomerase-like uncharacterized protein
MAQTTPAADLMEQAFKAVSNKDLAALGAFWHDDILEEFVVTGPLRGKAEVRAYFEEVWAAIPDDWSFEVERILPVDDNVAIGAWRLTGTFDGGSFQGIAATGKPVDIRGIDVMEFEDGLLRHNTIYYDGLAFARQVGMLPSDGSAADRAVKGAFNAVTKARRTITRR